MHGLKHIRKLYYRLNIIHNMNIRNFVPRVSMSQIHYVWGDENFCTWALYHQQSLALENFDLFYICIKTQAK